MKKDYVKILGLDFLGLVTFAFGVSLLAIGWFEPLKLWQGLMFSVMFVAIFILSICLFREAYLILKKRNE